MNKDTINRIAEFAMDEICLFYQKRTDGEIDIDSKNARIIIKDIIYKAIKDAVGET